MNIENTKIIFLRSNNVDHNGAFGMTINDILCDNCKDDLKRLICCDYQRPYTWNKEQITELINDIGKCGDNDSHFIGILYFGLAHTTNHGKPIIDGQQRIITFFLILYYLHYQKNFWVEIKIDDKYYSLNKILEDEEVSKKSLLLNEYKKHMNDVLEILKCYFYDKDHNFKENFIDKLLKKLYFLAIVCTDQKTEQELFIDINSKGIKLDDIDKIKAFLLTRIYKDDLSTFIKYWTILNKNGKDSINLFLKILMNALTGKNSSGRVKYEKFVDIYKGKCKNLEDFKNQFEQAIQRFEIIPFNNDEKFSCDGNKNLKNLYASIHLARSLRVFSTFIQEITIREKFNDYMNGKRSPIILFLLYILSYICELNFSFKNADSRRKITDFQKMSERERKEQVQKLWAKCKNKDGECQLDEIEIKIHRINDDTSHINEKSKCVFPLLVLSLSKHLDFYDQCKNNSGKKNIDHIIPKKMLFDKEPYIPKNRKGSKYKFDCIGDNSELKKLICSIYNNQLMSESGNKNKSDSLDDRFCIIDNNGEIIGVNYEKIKSFLLENKEELIKNLDKVIFELTK